MWCYIQLHRTMPNSGEGVGVFLIKQRGVDELEMHFRPPRDKPLSPSSKGKGSGSSGAQNKHKLGAAERRERLTAGRGGGRSAPPQREDEEPFYNAYAERPFGDDNEVFA